MIYWIFKNLHHSSAKYSFDNLWDFGIFKKKTVIDRIFMAEIPESTIKEIKDLFLEKYYNYYEKEVEIFKNDLLKILESFEAY